MTHIYIYDTNRDKSLPLTQIWEDHNWSHYYCYNVKFRYLRL